jgi:haloacetate dehalogenase
VVARDNRRPGRRHGGLKIFAPEAMAEHVRCFSDPATVQVTCGDDRASASINLNTTPPTAAHS